MTLQTLVNSRTAGLNPPKQVNGRTVVGGVDSGRGRSASTSPNYAGSNSMNYQRGSVGVKAADPNANVELPPKAIAPKFTAPAPINLTPSESQNRTVLGSANGVVRTDTLADHEGANDPRLKQNATPTYGGLIGQLVKNAQGPSSQFDRAYKAAQNINAQIQESRTNEANALAANASNPIPLEFQQGRGQVLQNQYLAQQNALASQFQGQSNLLGAANTQQATQQAGLLGAAGLAQPQLAGYNQQAFNPLTGGFSGGDMTGAVQSIAQRVQSGQMTYNDAVTALSGYGQGGTNALQQALGPNFNVNQSNAGGSIQAGQSEQMAGYQSAMQQGQNLQAQLTDLIGTFGLNPNDVNAANAGLQAIARNTSNVHYQQLKNYINDIANTYAQVLTPPGGSQTDTSRGIAASMLDSTMSGSGIIQVMQSLDQAARAKIAGVQTQGFGQGGGGLYDW